MTRTRHRWIMLEGFQIVKNDKPYLDRLRVVQTPLFSIYLHRIHTPDVDEFPHDHPWWFASLVLSGAYVECVYSDPLLILGIAKFAEGLGDHCGNFHVVRRTKSQRLVVSFGLLY